MDAYKNLEKEIEQHGIKESSNNTVSSLVRLTKIYQKDHLEYLITESMKLNIFLYVFFPIDQMPGHPNGWCALTQNEIRLIINLEKNKYIRFYSFEFNLNDLWVNKNHANSLLLTINTSVKKTKPRRRKDDALMQYVDFHSNGESYKTWLEMMINNGYVFNSEKDYLRNNIENTDNSHEHIQRVALVKNGKTASGEDKFNVFYKEVINDKKLSGHKFKSSATVYKYFLQINNNPTNT